LSLASVNDSKLGAGLTPSASASRQIGGGIVSPGARPRPSPEHFSTANRKLPRLVGRPSCTDLVTVDCRHEPNHSRHAPVPDTGCVRIRQAGC